MSIFRVRMIQTVSTTVDVDADNYKDAIDIALTEAPAPTNSSNHGIDPAGDWTEVAVYDESGEEVWTDPNA